MNREELEELELQIKIRDALSVEIGKKLGQVFPLEVGQKPQPPSMEIVTPTGNLILQKQESP